VKRTPMSRAAATVPLFSLVCSSDDGAQASSTSTSDELAATFVSDPGAPDSERPSFANRDPSGTTSQVPRATPARPASPRAPWLRRPQRGHSLPAEVSNAQRSRGGFFLAVGLLLACAACKPEQDPKQKCSAKTKCATGFKCENDGRPVSGPLDVGECEKDHCAVTVPCEKPQHAQHPKEPCINDLVEACDLHDANKFCKCVSTTNNQSHVTTSNTPTTG